MAASQGLLETVAESNPLAIVTRLKQGLPYRAVTRFQRTSELPLETTCQVS